MAASAGLIGKGAILEYGTSEGTYGSKIANMMDCNIPDWFCDVVDVTHNDSPSGYREKLAGFFDHEPFRGSFRYDHTEFLEAHSIKGATKFWEITLSNTKTIRFSGFINRIGSPVPYAADVTYDIEITVDTAGLTIAS